MSVIGNITGIKTKKNKGKLTYKERNGSTRVGDFLRGVGGVAPEILEIASKIIPGAGGLSVLAERIKGTDSMSELDKEIALRELDLDMAEAEQVTRRWEADMHSDSWLSKNVRPLTLAFVILSTITIIVLDSSLDTFTVEEHWVSLLTSLLITTVGGYFTLREAGKYFNKKGK
tara:strand:+ start:1085 stop:1603 length:519 start_codon:yes stop_codon:yes gene_type:complete